MLMRSEIEGDDTIANTNSKINQSKKEKNEITISISPNGMNKA
jgi:hypothetical protein